MGHEKLYGDAPNSTGIIMSWINSFSWCYFEQSTESGAKFSINVERVIRPRLKHQLRIRRLKVVLNRPMQEDYLKLKQRVMFHIARFKKIFAEHL
jgi:hypothetical protein